jgi:hypothetical protein
MLVRHGRECKNCSASGSPMKGTKDACPLKPYLGKRPAKVELPDSKAGEDEASEKAALKEEAAAVKGEALSDEVKGEVKDED